MTRQVTKPRRLIGHAVTDPATGERGWITRFVGNTAICKSDVSGGHFRLRMGPNKPPREAPCHVWINGIAQRLEGVIVEKRPRRKVRVTTPDPVWHGCVVSEKDATIRVIKKEKANA